MIIQKPYLLINVCNLYVFKQINWTRLGTPEEWLEASSIFWLRTLIGQDYIFIQGIYLDLSIHRPTDF